ncbi:MAG: AAA family ATPase [Lachnospiraceae bacterium]|nr:AAA family ATPase [Lachnospiraceae bacterium]
MKKDQKIEIAVYGKGGIGKSTMSANLSTALAMTGRKVLQIGCDPKHDSTRMIMHGKEIQTVLDYLKEHDKNTGKLEEILFTGAFGIGCVEAGGPKPGVGCAGRGIISAFEFLDIHHAKEAYDLVVYDVLGDVVCGGFAVPVRREYADAIFLVTSGEYMALYAANNILRGIRNYDNDTYKRVAGIIYNQRKVADEDGRVNRFAEAVGLPIVAKVPRSNAFAFAEEAKKTVMEMEGFPEEKQIFTDLANKIYDGMPLYKAKPLSDDELEKVVLNIEPIKPLEVLNDTEDNSTGKVSETLEDDTFEKTVSAKRPPLYGCAFNGAATAAIHLTDAMVIAHSPRACAFYTWQNISSPGRKNLFNRGILMPSAISPNFACTDMGQTEAVFGGMEKLSQTVKEAMKKDVGAVVVISSCVSGIIGDDIQSLEELETDETPVIIIDADGVMAGDYMAGIRLCMRRIAEKLIDPTVPPQGRMVNLINETGFSNNNEVNYQIIKSLLEAMNIKINARFLGDTTSSEMRNFCAAPLNILASDSPDGLELKTWLQEKYGSRFTKSCLPIGFQETKNWLYEIAGEFECTELVPKILAKEEEKYKARLEKIRPFLKGKKILITTINSSLDWLLDTADDLEMEVVWIGVLNYLHMPLHISNHEKFQGIASEEVSSVIIQDKIKETKPDIVVTNYTSLLEEGDYVTDTLFMTQVVGFQSGIHVMERWVDLLGKKDSQKKDMKGDWQNDKWLFEKYFG